MEENKINYYKIFLNDGCKDEFVAWFVEVMQKKHGISKEKLVNFLGKQLNPWVIQCLSWGFCYNIALRVFKPMQIMYKCK